MKTHLSLVGGRRELARRLADEIEVTLQWTPSTNAVSVAVHDRRTAEAFELVLDANEDALDVFSHPYAYAAWRGLEFSVLEADDHRHVRAA
jgi:hypothetical protein